jgi:hypothetical protein
MDLTEVTSAHRNSKPIPLDEKRAQREVTKKVLRAPRRFGAQKKPERYPKTNRRRAKDARTSSTAQGDTTTTPRVACCLATECRLQLHRPARAARSAKAQPDRAPKKVAGAAARRHCTRNEHDRPTVGLSIPYAFA